MVIGKNLNVTYQSTGRHPSRSTRRISMRNRSAETANQRRRVFAFHRWAMTVLLVPTFCSVVVAQIEPMRERGPHTLYGDIRVETEPGNESLKPLSLEVQLYIINGT